MSTATLEEIFVHPVKSLDATAVEAARIVENGGLAWDRRYAIVDADGEYVNGKRERRIHRLRSRVDCGGETIHLATDDADERSFHLEADREELSAYLTSFFGYEVSLVRDDDGGFPDDTEASGPTVIAAATLEAVASWFDGIEPAEMRRRLRPNLVIGGVPAFWEDRLYDRPGRTVGFDVGDAALEGVNPCQRCVVPSRDPNTGEETAAFRERFLENREATLPDWANDDWFDHYYRLMVNTRVRESSWGRRLAVGDAVSIGTAKPDPNA